MPERKPIFYDQERRRWRRTRRVLEITGGLFTLMLVVFVVNVVRKPELPDILSAGHALGSSCPAREAEAQNRRARPQTQNGRARQAAAELRSAARGILCERRFHQPRFAASCITTTLTC